jgi:hypothetical protein
VILYRRAIQLANDGVPVNSIARVFFAENLAAVVSQVSPSRTGRPTTIGDRPRQSDRSSHGGNEVAESFD